VGEGQVKRASHGAPLSGKSASLLLGTAGDVLGHGLSMA
jgi:hypothetical protein